jgi:hypothetical protein
MNKKNFIKFIKLINKQREKEYKFADFMESYLDGRCVPILSEHMWTACNLMWCTLWNDTEKDSWLEWFIYENECGKRKFEVKFCNESYVIDSIDSFYDMMLEWRKKKLNNEL